MPSRPNTAGRLALEAAIGSGLEERWIDRLQQAAASSRLVNRVRGAFLWTSLKLT
jgi:hypothetical protein